MKKAKIMLSALTVLAFLSTGFAFKAKTFTEHVLYTGANSLDCTHPVVGVTITAAVGMCTYVTTDQFATRCLINCYTATEE